MLLVRGRRSPRSVDGKVIALCHRSSAKNERKWASGQGGHPQNGEGS